MPRYDAPLKDMNFILNEVLNVGQLTEYEKFAEAESDILAAILEEGGKFSREVLAPLNIVGDHEGCKRHDDGSVTTPTGFKEAYDQMVQNGYMGMSQPAEYGGMGMPGLWHLAAGEMQSAANMAFAMYPGLTNGAIKAIKIGGSEDQKQTYLPKMIAGTWTGTMNLTEPHCGTDLGLLKTKAVPNADGSYKISGQKIFISAGEHDMAENIIHLVLARVEGAPTGVKGISLFIVPKFKLDNGGNPGDGNGVSCGSIEEKMGIHGNSTCVMNYDEAEGYMIGEENKGLKVMFVMMNRARLDVGMQGLAQSEVAYQNAVDYAKDRLQGRALTGPKNENGPADPIIVHPDVRRMLMDTKAFNEGARMLVYWAGLLEDLELVHGDEKFVEKCDDLLGLLTPVIKGYLTDRAMQTTIDCQQIYGGHGYIEEWGMSQFVRDTRIAAIYEGANGIQALDLVGRKLARKGGRALMSLNADIDAFISEQSGNDDVAEFVQALTDAKNKLTEGTNDEFYSNKIITGRYFIQRVLPMIDTHLARLKTGAEPVMALTAEAF